MTKSVNPSVLIIDDSRSFARKLATLLESAGYSVETVESPESALELLGIQPHPTFIIADRQLQGKFVENSALNKIARAAGLAHVVVYTQKANLNDSEIRFIQGKGAKRVLDRNQVTKLVEDIGRLKREFDDLLELAQELTVLTKERAQLVTALVGVDVGVTVIDTEFHCWFANEAQERFVGRLAYGGLCWECFHGHPASVGPCWGCTVSRVVAMGHQIERLFLSRFWNGSLKWVSVRSTPIFGRDKPATKSTLYRPTVIAVREAVVEAGQSTINGLSLQSRLEYIAQGLIHAGFGRARIWSIRADGQAVIRAAASISDDPWAAQSDYQQELGDLVVQPDDCPYNRKARLDDGLLVDVWTQGMCPWIEELELEPPYFLLPVWNNTSDLWGFLAVDFVGIPKIAQKEVISHYVNQETLHWLRAGYVHEIRKAFEDSGQATPELMHSAKVELAELGIGGARSIEEGLTAVCDALCGIVSKDCTVSLRRLSKHGLEEYDALSWGPDSPSEFKVIDLNDQHSLAAYVFRVRRARWISNFPKHIENAKNLGQPPGYPSKSTASTAHIPLKLEGNLLGTISIDSPKPLNWIEGGYISPLLRMAELAALVVRDLWVNEKIAERQVSLQANLNAMKAFSETVGSDAIWRHWALQRLGEASSLIDRTRRLVASEKMDPKEATDLLHAAGDAIHLVCKKGPPPESSESCLLSEVVVDLLESYQKRPPFVRLDVPEGLPQIRAGKYYVRQILDILLKNSFTATEVHLKACISDGQVRIKVRDNGPGIPKAIMGDILQGPVNSERGRGMGLLIARGTALRFSGDLEIVPVEKGASFLLILPSVG
ncbi:ATP-binding protein [Planctomycetota bacterium]